jgi:hypothetical protein
VTRVDRNALKRALQLVRNEPEYREQIECKLKTEPWEHVADSPPITAKSTIWG